MSDYETDKRRSVAKIKIWQPRERELPQSEILLWTTPEGPPRALQASECRELLDPTRASCLILAQRQPGKFNYVNASPMLQRKLLGEKQRF